MRSLSVALLLWLAAATAARAEGPAMPLPFGAAGAAPQPPWHVAGLPNQTKPFTAFSVVEADGRQAVRIEADASYGNLVYPLKIERPAFQLAWQWRVDNLIDAVNLREKQGDDTAVKVCVFFDEPLDRVSFVERQLLKVARSQTSEAVPAATVCYVWDAHLAVGTALDSPFTHRLRYKILQSGTAHLHQWMRERRDVAADFLELFGKESPDVPPVIGVAIGADADNTHGKSAALVAEVKIE